MAINREELLERRPLTEYVQDKGARLKRNGQTLITNLCPIQEHKPGHLCVSIFPGKQRWHCNDHDEGGTIFDWIMHETGKSLKTVLNELSGVSTPSEAKNAPQSLSAPGKAILEVAYDYTDESGKLLFQVCRYKPKTFKQRQPDEFGGWIWGLEGVTRVLFNLPAVLTSKEVFVVEGEKDALTLIGMEYVATTSAGGAKNWLAAYGDTLKGKDVTIIPDNDEPGEVYAQLVIESLTDKANSVKLLRLPTPHHDVSDFVKSFADLPKAKAALEDLISRTPHAVAPLPLYSIGEMETKYRKFVRGLKTKSLNLGNLIPGLGKITRHLVPGELVLILSGTGTGKTCLVQSIAKAAAPLPTLIFELELPLELMFERFAQMEVGCRGQDVEDDYKSNDDDYSESWTGLKHVIVCPESGLTAAQIESYILRSELKFGEKPVLVCVDYIGLVKAQSRSRYEAVSENAEQMKVIAKRTGTIIVMTSQISRPSNKKEDIEVGLHDAKDSGCLSRASTRLLTASGFRYTSEEMQTVTLKTNKLVSIQSSEIDNGEKQCIRLTLKSGRFIECTPEHKILTDKGWIDAGVIDESFAVACARKCPPPKRTTSVPEARVMGWMIGDGCMLGHSAPHFTSADPVLSEEFVSEIEKIFRLTPKRRKLGPGKSHDEFYITTGGYCPKNGNPMTSWLRDKKMWGFRSFEKHVPQWFKDTANDSSIAELLGGLLDTDGCVKRPSGRTQIKFSTSSEVLAWDILFCLTRLGIFGRFVTPEMKRKPGFNKRSKKFIIPRRVMYGVLIDDSREVKRFSDSVRITKRKGDRLIGFQVAKRPSNLGDNLGAWAWKRLAETAKKEGINTRQYMMARCQDRRISHQLLGELLLRMRNPPPELSRLVNPSIYWDRPLGPPVPIGPSEVFDRSVNPETPNFIANGIVVHNSLENSAGLILGCWRSDPRTLIIKVLKNTKGQSGAKIECDFDGAKMQISERSKAKSKEHAKETEQAEWEI